MYLLKIIKVLTDVRKKKQGLEESASSSSTKKGIVCIPKFPIQFGIKYEDFENTLKNLIKDTDHSHEKYKDIMNHVTYYREKNQITRISLAHIVDPKYNDKFTITIENLHGSYQLIHLYK